MSSKQLLRRVKAVSVLLPLLGLVVAIALGCEAKGEPKKDAESANVVELWRSATGRLEVFDNSDTFSQAVAINAAGHIIGVREQPDPQIASTNQRYFFSDGQQTLELPRLNGYTNSEVAALSDTGLAVGFASRPPGHPQGSLTAILWDTRKNEVTDLGKLPDDGASHAQDISADGKRVVGYSTGAEPARLRPCIWEQDAASGSWTASALPTMNRHNPFLVSGGTAISPDGKWVAACATYAITPQGDIDNATFRWQLIDGKWQRELVSDETLRIAGINNAGQMAVNITTNKGKMPAAIGSDGRLVKIDLLPGDVSGGAFGLDANGNIYGLSDDPPGPDGGPQAIFWQDGRTHSPEFSLKAFYSCINDMNPKGQMVGYIDVLIIDGKLQLLGPQEADYSPNALGKTLAYRWTPAQ